MAAQPTSSMFYPPKSMVDNMCKMDDRKVIENITDNPHNFLKYHALEDSLLTMDDLKYLSEYNITWEDVSFYKSLSDVRESFGGSYCTISDVIIKSIGCFGVGKMYNNLNPPNVAYDIVRMAAPHQVETFGKFWDNKFAHTDIPVKNIFLQSYVNEIIGRIIEKHIYNITGFVKLYALDRVDYNILHEKTYHLLKLIYYDTYTVISDSYMYLSCVYSPKFPLDKITEDDDLFKLVFSHGVVNNEYDLQKIKDMFTMPELIDYKYLKNLLYKRFDRG